MASSLGACWSSCGTTLCPDRTIDIRPTLTRGVVPHRRPEVVDGGAGVRRKESCKIQGGPRGRAGFVTGSSSNAPPRFSRIFCQRFFGPSAARWKRIRRKDSDAGGEEDPRNLAQHSSQGTSSSFSYCKGVF
ncbi:unnamed protein product [Bursaphelenchus xylophilus]|uniref:(pine wood nematode) hypothetical protein n=1 Tax=Bursaphelenchus xylophilus TaxID=6326 RepID=A0A811LLQ3_BURXY|nr:unnamed protein product [Bursaphelenchus xylophilus]CAG9119186.1 unnamed protein product [Bursaphelenchus xylophilus]